jgi:hypothetical protein
VIYPVSQVSQIDSINNCYILKIKGWNTIIFEKDNVQDTVLAIAAVRNGRFIDFRTREEVKNNAYPHIFGSTDKKDIIKNEKYYQLQYQQAVKQKRGGAAVSIIGAFAGLTSIFIIDGNMKNDKPTRLVYTVGIIGGGILFNLGTPIWISGSIKAKKSKEAMMRHQQKNLSLNYGVTNNGVGLVLKF